MVAAIIFTNNIAKIKELEEKIEIAYCGDVKKILSRPLLLSLPLYSTLDKEKYISDTIQNIKDADILVADLFPSVDDDIIEIEKRTINILDKGKEILYNDDLLERIITKKEEKHEKNTLNPNSCLCRCICTDCFLRKYAGDEDVRFRIGELGAVYKENLEKERNKPELCIGTECQKYLLCTQHFICYIGMPCVYDDGPVPRGNGIIKREKSEYGPKLGKLYVREGGPVVGIDLGRTCSGNDVRRDGDCRCNCASGSGESEPRGNAPSCGCCSEQNR